MKHCFCYLIFIVLCFNSYSQKVKNSKSKEVIYSLRDAISILKKITLCNYLINGFPKDSLEYKNPLVYILLEEISCSFDFLDSIKPYTDKFMDFFKKSNKGQNRENTYNSRIMIGCTDLYNSKGLNNFLIIFYKKNRNFFN